MLLSWRSLTTTKSFRPEEGSSIVNVVTATGGCVYVVFVLRQLLFHLEISLDLTFDTSLVSYMWYFYDV